MQRPSRVFLGSVMGAVVIFALILTAQAAPDLRQQPNVLQPEATLELTPPTFELLPESVLLEAALTVAKQNDLDERVSLADLEASQIVYTTYDQLTRLDGIYAHFAPDNAVLHPPKRPVFIAALVHHDLHTVFEWVNPTAYLTTTPRYEFGLVVFLFADTGEALQVRKLAYPKTPELMTTPRPHIPELPSRETGAILPMETLLQTALANAKGRGIPDAVTIDDLDVSRSVITTWGQWHAYQGRKLVRPWTSGYDMNLRPVFVIPIAGRGFRPIGGPPIPNATPETYSIMTVELYADTGEFFGAGFAPTGSPMPDYSLLRAYSPFYGVASPQVPLPEVTLELTPAAYELLPEDVLLEKALVVAKSWGLSKRVTLDDLADARRLYSTYIHLTEFLPTYSNPERYNVSKFSRPIFVAWIVGKGLRMVIGGLPYPPCLDHTQKITPGIVIALFADTGQLISTGNFGSAEYIPKAKDDPTIDPEGCGGE